MVTAAEWGEVYALLEGGEGASEAFSSVRESWLVRGWLHYYARTGSAKALDLLARAPDVHARHLLDALMDELTGDAASRAKALATLAPLLARKPRWLHRVPSSLAPELARLARVESEPTPRLHALLALCPLLAHCPQAAKSLLSDLAAALVRGLASNNPHLQVACHAAFQVSYSVVPGEILSALRAEVNATRGSTSHEIAALLRSVRLHPALVLRDCGDDALEAPPASPRAAPSAPPVFPSTVAPPMLTAPGDDSWFPLRERCGADSAPPTPVPVEQPDLPEPAVEATPENTPAKEVRAAFSFPSEPSGAVRALRTESPLTGAMRALRTESPLTGGAGAGRLLRLVADRERAVESPVCFTAAPPGNSVRPAPRRPAPRRYTPPRATSAPPPVRRPRAAVATQTTEAPMLPPDVTRLLLDASPMQLQKEEDDSGASAAWSRLDEYLTRLYDGTTRISHDELANQLALTHVQLMYERSRREAHAERNRRLLGRCRQARGSELALGEVKERVKVLTAEIDELRARLARPVDNSDAAHCDALEDELERERTARVHAEAALAEVIADRDRHRAESHQLRAEAADATRRAESLEHAAELAERRADTVRRLRREVIILGEREARLSEELRGRLSAPPRPVPPPPRSPPEPATASHLTRIADLEATVATRDSQITQLKKLLTSQAEEQTARQQSMDDKYRALVNALHRIERRKLYSGPELPPLPPMASSELSWPSTPLQDLIADEESS